MKTIKSKFLRVTTPIFYVNAAPHLGHLYTATYCDAIKKSQRHFYDKVELTTGTDEHGTKV